MLKRLSEWYRRFMYGRYGIDTMFVGLVSIWFILGVINSFLHWFVITLLEAAVVVYALCRMLSKNIAKRRSEEEKFSRIWYKMQSKSKVWVRQIRDSKYFVYKKCPNCKAILRLKKIKGKHIAVCPKCGSDVNINVKF